ncbi:DUF202 domain-containing protein [Mycobacterium interjectum]|uniref:DUF202 domain-containing protein n=1 Tax=Mycobacterium interjectum TaxID=33895 RepID=UPI00082AB450|nr:DUF202 domain-containing protein [Mycobacterium interjectum]MCV7091118.1 DUF202 domain-containing protein [Mycobacterium interjectum]
MSEPADRTSLAWTRTSFAFLGNGALLMIRNLRGPVGLKELIPALLAGAVALMTYLIALQRQRVLREHATPEQMTPRRQVYVIGTAVLVLVVATTVGQLI